MEQKELNTVFYSNLNTLIRLAKESLQNNEFQKSEFQNSLLNKTFKNYDLEESSHLQNSDWILLNSIFISMFSHFEYKLYLYCKKIEKKKSFNLKLEHLNGSTLTKYFNYLKLVANLNAASKETNEYQHLTKFQKTRNVLVHNGGLMITDRTQKLESHELYKFLKDKNVVMAGDGGIIRIINVEFLEHFFSVYKNVCDDLAAEINDNFR